jgi:hypothetical protein
MPSQTIEAEGHLIDSGDLQGILTTIVEHGAAYEIERFEVGRTNSDASRLTITVAADSDTSLDHLLEKLSPYGCYVHGTPDAQLRAADVDGAAPDDFSRRRISAPRSISMASVRVEGRPGHRRRPEGAAASPGSCAIWDQRRRRLPACGMR